VNSLFGGYTPWREFWVYVAGPLIGAVLATLAYVVVARPVREVPEAAAQGTEGEIEGRRMPIDNSLGQDVRDGENVPDGHDVPDRLDRPADHPNGRDDERR
jgi:glycerol uptake facilitator protein